MLRQALEDWYCLEARDLPWRRDRDPYRVWVSEAMLQQTRVEVVVERYEAFLARFPRIEDLAAASEEEVLALWSGLGYYSRARKLREAARVVCEDHDGEFPRDRAAALALPGVGPYTAGAVLSIAHGLPEALVDGNVERVLCRLFGFEGDPKRGPLKQKLWAKAQELVEAATEAGLWNQALMELGSLCCTPRNPDCEGCPLAAHCVALREGRVQELPQLAARRESVEVQLELFWVRRADELLLHRRPAGGRMAGLLELPTREVANGAGAISGLFPATWPDSGLEQGEFLQSLSHSITHHKIRARLFEGALASTAPLAEGLVWLEIAALADSPTSGLLRKALARVVPD